MKMFMIIIIKYEIGLDLPDIAVQRIARIFYISHHLLLQRCGGAMGESFGPASGRLGVRIQAATARVEKQVVTAPLLNARQ